VRLTVGQAIVRFLQAQYSLRDGQVRRLVPGIAGIFGHGNVAGLGQGITQEGRELSFIQGHNEQSMVHMATAFARERRRTQTLAVTSSVGPGATNMVTGAALATINRIPVLLLPGDVYATRRQGPVLQQLENPSGGDVSVNDCFRPVSRFFDRILRPEQLGEALLEGMRVLADPVETGAVTLALPQDVQSEAFDFPDELFETRVWPIDRLEADRTLVERAVQLIGRSSRPLIIAGGGVWYSEAERELEEFATRFSVPVAETFAGKGVMSTDGDLSLGGIGVEGGTAANQLAAEADLVIGVGTRLSDFVTGSRSLFANPAVKFLGINVVARDAARQSGMALRSDARVALKLLGETLGSGTWRAGEEWIARAASERTAWRERLSASLAPLEGGLMSQAGAIRVINDQAGPDDILVSAAGAPPGELLKAWDATGGRRCHIEFGFSCMGYELPGGLGARLARSEGEVVVIVGDGSFLLNPGEIATMAQLRARVTVVILDNSGYQVIRRLQLAKTATSFGNEFRVRSKTLDLGVPGAALDDEGELATPDLEGCARGLGAVALKAAGDKELRDALLEARKSDGPVVIVVPVAKQAWTASGGAFWDVAPAEVSDEPALRELRAVYEQDRKRQRFHPPTFGLLDVGLTETDREDT